VSLVRDVDSWFVNDAPEDVVVLAVAVDLTNENKVTRFEDQYGLSVTVLADQDGEWLPVWGGYGGTDQHSYTIVDSTGRVSWHKEGSTTADKIAKKAESAP